MDRLCLRIKNLILIPIEDRNKYKAYVNKSKSMIICTPELNHYLAQIMHKCAIIKTTYQFVPLGDLLQKDKYYENRIRTTVENANQILNCLEYRLGLEDFIKQPENEIRARIPQELERLIWLSHQLEPLFAIAQESIKSANDHLGITDRFLGYRNNLRLNSHYNNGQKYAADLKNSSRPEMAPRFNVPGWNTWKVESPRSSPTYHDSEKFKQWKSNTIERVGIATDYPNQSETKSAYTNPPRPIVDVLNNHGKVVPCRPGYQINPNPNLEAFGYRLSKMENLDKPKSEYTISYQYPDAKNATPYPWKRGQY